MCTAIVAFTKGGLTAASRTVEKIGGESTLFVPEKSGSTSYSLQRPTPDEVYEYLGSP